MLLRLPDDSINDLVRKTMKEAINFAKRAHYTNVSIRVGGEDVVMEADWIKYLEIEPEQEGAMRRFLFWLVRNVPLGRAAPWILGLGLGRKPQRVRPADDGRTP